MLVDMAGQNIKKKEAGRALVEKQRQSALGKE
jgi:hypothetical protein